MKFHFLTLFPEMISSYLGESMLAKAQAKGLVDFDVKNIRDYSTDKHHKADDRPYGGGPGMVMMPEPILSAHAALTMKAAVSAKASTRQGKIKVVMLSPTGKRFTNVMAAKLAKQYTDIVFICGRYEGVDDRVRKVLKADEISIGDFVLTGGELPALVMTDAICRQIKGVLGDSASIEEHRNASPRTYTRPDVLSWKGKKYRVPKVLMNGNHKDIEAWRKNQQK